MTLRLREHQANCRNHKQHSAVVDHSAIGHSWGFNRAKIVTTQRNTIKRKIAESLFISRLRNFMQEFLVKYAHKYAQKSTKICKTVLKYALNIQKNYF